MGNALRFIHSHYNHNQQLHSSDSLVPQGISTSTVDVIPAHQGISTSTADISALARDLHNFEITSQVPEGLSKHVSSAKRAQLGWYKKLADAWKNTSPPPRTPDDVSKLIVKTLKKHRKADVEGLLVFYGLPLPQNLVEISDGVLVSFPQGVKFEVLTLPVDAKAVSDGDTINVYVSTTTNPREASCVPNDVHQAVAQRSKAQSQKNYTMADELHSQIVNQGYRVLNFQNEEVLGRKYRIRLRGIDAPESAMPCGKEAKAELLKLVEGQCLRVFVYDVDRYGRSVGDVYSNDVFVQEVMLKKGLAWHYAAYDKRPELANWEKAARDKRVGLWASSNPEKPWEWRKNKRAKGNE